MCPLNQYTLCLIGQKSHSCTDCVIKAKIIKSSFFLYKFGKVYTNIDIENQFLNIGSYFISYFLLLLFIFPNGHGFFCNRNCYQFLSYIVQTFLSDSRYYKAWDHSIKHIAASFPIGSWVALFSGCWQQKLDFCSDVAHVFSSTSPPWHSMLFEKVCYNK